MSNTVPRIRERLGSRTIDTAVVLGTGLGAVADALKDPIVMDYTDLHGFPQPSVKGHAGRLFIGTVGTKTVAALQGRTHSYETGRADGMKVALNTLKRLGCKTLILTNSAGSLMPQAGPGSLVMITDHINFSGPNPLTGETGNERFVNMNQAYDAGLQASYAAMAKNLGITLHQGVYMWFAGPSFETPAEIRMAKVLGADVVGMSTVPEVIIARWLGLKVVAFSAIANLAAGMTDEALSHETSLAKSAEGAQDLIKLLIAELENDHV